MERSILRAASDGAPDPASASGPGSGSRGGAGGPDTPGRDALARGLRSARPAGSLSGNQLSVLSLLYRGGPRTPTDIATAEGQQPQSLTRTFADLERSGLVRRTQSEVDRRQHLLEITPEGLYELGADMAVRDAWLRSRLAGLTETERELLRLAGALLERIADNGPESRLRGVGVDVAGEAGASAIPIRGSGTGHDTGPGTSSGSGNDTDTEGAGAADQPASE